MASNRLIKCVVCKNQEEADVCSDTMVSCDGCSRFIHKKCTDLTASEFKVMDLKNKRTLKFFCDDCNNGLLNVSKLIGTVEELKSEVEELKSELEKLKAASTSSNKEPDYSSGGISQQVNSEEVIREMTERQKRAHNLMIFNMPEGGEDLDEVEVKRLLNIITQKTITIQNMSRVGKKNKNGFRALRVSLSSQHEVFEVMKNKSKLQDAKVNTIFINTDLTSSQRIQISKVKDELRERTTKGETDLYIKYINGLPRILSKN